MNTPTLIRPTPTNSSGAPASPSQADSESLVLAATIELLMQLESCDSSQDAATIISERLREFTGARCVLVGSCCTADATCRLIGQPKLAGVPWSNELSRKAEYALDEVLIRGRLTEIDVASNDHAQLATGQFGVTIGAARMIGAPLRDRNNEIFGAWLFVDPPTDMNDPGCAKIVDAISQPLGARLTSIANNRPSRVDRTLRYLQSVIQRSQTTAIVVGLITALGVMLFPIPFRVGCDCKLQPVSRRFVAAPFDGQLIESLVEPGDIVEQGQLLAKMNARELQWELAGVSAELSRASKQRSVSLAEQEYANSQIANLDSRRLEARRDLINKRIEHLEIRSPIAGVVVSGDIRESEGAPVETGQSLLEIAPLGEMIVELAVPEEYFAYVRAGMQVRLRLRAFPSETIQGVVDRVRPRAEVIDGENVFLAEMRTADPHGIYRPGMHGRASIRSERRPVVWILLHKPWSALVMWWS